MDQGRSKRNYYWRCFLFYVPATPNFSLSFASLSNSLSLSPTLIATNWEWRKIDSKKEEESRKMEIKLHVKVKESQQHETRLSQPWTVDATNLSFFEGHVSNYRFCSKEKNYRGNFKREREREREFQEREREEKSLLFVSFYSISFQKKRLIHCFFLM